MSKPAELRQIHVTAHQGYPQHDCPLCASLLARKFTWQPGDTKQADCPGCGYPLPNHEAKCQYRGLDETGINREELTAWDRAETDACERGTVGCSVKHTRDSECQTW
jgi:hypothetical protein